MPAVRKYRRDTSEVSCCLKYVIFGFNVMFWWLGLGIMAVGVWAWTEKDTFNNLSRLTNVALDPAFILILVGTVTFIIGFTGCVGALRENTCLLATLQCCGIEGPKDWDRNNYFNCSSSDIGSREACGVPFSCCKRKPNEIIKNKQCGYDVRKPSYTGERSIYERGCLRAGEEWLELNLVPVAGTVVSTMVLQPIAFVLQNYEVAKVIYEKGCIQAGEEWVERNLLAIVTGAVTTAFAQILGICFAQNLRADIFAQKAKWH
ncbi:tetraspanin-5 isoform X6 [Bombus pyrosoma]|uniref:tetraspanin-5 isoform X6 n=1 Tax=Bombus pyrosoma TaxID=396416 RepID=UPI001CB959EA|nr:tetraspanin-5 isoform X6 [Bombus pyrosoma]